MKRFLLLMVGAILVAGLTGCAGHRGWFSGLAGGGACCPPAASCDPCDDPCGNDKCVAGPGAWGPMCGADNSRMAGPPTGAYAYPYYTNRAPRDFLMTEYPPIGP